MNNYFNRRERQYVRRGFRSLEITDETGNVIKTVFVPPKNLKDLSNGGYEKQNRDVHSFIAVLTIAAQRIQWGTDEISLFLESLEWVNQAGSLISEQLV